MFQVFNMGQRLEIFTGEKNAAEIIDVAAAFGIAAQVIGRVEESPRKELIIRTGSEEIKY